MIPFLVLFVSNFCIQSLLDYADCTNTEGSFTCKCSDGFIDDYDPNSPNANENITHGMRCSDRDECQLGIHDCAPEEACFNLEPFWKCDCPPKYTRTAITNFH